MSVATALPADGVAFYDHRHCLDPRMEGDDYELFTEGDCHHLALALHERTGWPLMIVSGRSTVEHAFVMRPDGLALDINGLSSVSHILDCWSWLDSPALSPVIARYFAVNWRVEPMFCVSTPERLPIVTEVLLDTYPLGP
jgi:hypothetical protein